MQYFLLNKFTNSINKYMHVKDTYHSYTTEDHSSMKENQNLPEAKYLQKEYGKKTLAQFVSEILMRKKDQIERISRNK